MKLFESHLNAALLLVSLAIFNLPIALAEQAGMCGLCGTEISQGSHLFVITYEDGIEQTYGCPACGLPMMASPQVVAAKTQDFLSRQMIDAKTAFYLKDTDVGFCCKPHWLSFSNQEQAQKFAKGFGGTVLTYQQAVKHQHSHTEHVH